VIYRGEQVYWVDLQELLTTGSPLADLRLRRNDVIFVPALSTKTVTVMGQVQHPGEISLRHDSTLSSILGEAGASVTLRVRTLNSRLCTGPREEKPSTFASKTFSSPLAAWKSRSIPATSSMCQKRNGQDGLGLATAWTVFDDG